VRPKRGARRQETVVVGSESKPKAERGGGEEKGKYLRRTKKPKAKGNQREGKQTVAHTKGGEKKLNKTTTKRGKRDICMGEESQ